MVVTKPFFNLSNNKFVMTLVDLTSLNSNLNLSYSEVNCMECRFRTNNLIYNL